MEIINIKSLFYPGAGNDYAVIKHFVNNSTIETFYFCDYLNRDFRPESILSEMRGQLKEFNIKYIASLQPAYFNQTNWEDFWCHESDGQTFSGLKENSFIALYRIEYLNKIVELYYFGTEAIETYRVLVENNIKIDLVITQDHGLGCLWTTFGEGSYLEAIARVNDKMPRYLLIGEHMRAWKGYDKLSEPFGAFGIHEHPRIMYQLSLREIELIEYKGIYNTLYNGSINY
ncbi:hypothetical protein V7S78_12030 [Aquirufa regiilacus]